MCHGDQPGAPPVDDLLHGHEVHAPLGGIGCAHHLDAEPFGQGEVLDLIGYVVVAGGHHHVAVIEGHGGKRLDEGGRGVFGEGHVSRVGVQEVRHGSIGGLDARCRFGRRLVTADIRFEVEMLVHRVHDDTRHE